MKTFKFIIGLIIGVILFLLFATLTSTLWPFFLIWFLIDWICQKIMRRTWQSKILQSFEEFIFLMYGFSTLFLALPFELTHE